jgi:outer membrane receptor protein involved in Fe transport
VPFRLNGFHRERWRQAIEQDTARVGAHFRIDHEQDLIVSAIYTSLKDMRNDHVFNTDDPDSFQHFNQKRLDISSENGFQTEIQYLFHPSSSSYDVTFGLGYLELETNDLIFRRGAFTEPPPVVIPELTFGPENFSDKTRHYNAYIYSKQYLLPSLTSTVALSFDSFQDDLVDRQEFNPKFGLIWNPIDNLTLRGAALRTLKRPLATNQTIEPTQIAGFNQFFDGFNGTLSRQYSLGVDYQPLNSLFVGGEVNWRYNEEPFSNGLSNNRDRDESSHLAYLYWIPSDWLSFSAEYRLDKFKHEFIEGEGNETDPQSISTHQIPLSVNFFHSSGVFAKLTTTYVSQKVALVTDFNNPPLKNDREQFWTVDTILGYRLPKKLGLISFEVRNLFNNHHSFQSAFDASGPQLTPFVPEREFFAKLSLSY